MNVMWKQFKKEYRPNKTKAAPLTDFFPLAETKASTHKILTLVQCVEELLLNSIESSPNCISVRIDASQAYVQVIDNGVGIKQADMLRLGEKKLPPDLELVNKGASPWYGHRGRAVDSIIDTSERFEIISRLNNPADSMTYRKTFRDGLGKVDKLKDDRPCAGTTVTVYNMFYKVPVRKKQMNERKVINEVLALIQGLAVSLAGTISLSLRDEGKGKVLVNTSKVKSPKDAILDMFGGEHCSRLHTLRGTCSGIQMVGIVSTVAYRGKKIKSLMLNHRHVSSNRIQQSVDALLKASAITLPHKDNGQDQPGGDAEKMVSKPKHFLYVVDIRCDPALYKTSFYSEKTNVEFYNWQAILNSIYKIVKKFLIKHNLYKINTVAKEVRDTKSVASEVDEALSHPCHSVKDKQVPDTVTAKPVQEKENYNEKEMNRNSTSQAGAGIQEECISPKKKSGHTDNNKHTLGGDASPIKLPISGSNESQPATLPHVVYWLTNYVPDKVPKLVESDYETGIETTTQLSTYPHPSSVTPNSPSSSLRSSANNCLVEGSHKPRIRRRFNTSLNEGKEPKSIFGRKLKVHMRNDSAYEYKPNVQPTSKRQRSAANQNEKYQVKRWKRMDNHTAVSPFMDVINRRDMREQFPMRDISNTSPSYGMICRQQLRPSPRYHQRSNIGEQGYDYRSDSMDRYGMRTIAGRPTALLGEDYPHRPFIYDQTEDNLVNGYYQGINSKRLPMNEIVSMSPAAALNGQYLYSASPQLMQPIAGAERKHDRGTNMQWYSQRLDHNASPQFTYDNQQCRMPSDGALNACYHRAGEEWYPRREISHTSPAATLNHQPFQFSHPLWRDHVGDNLHLEDCYQTTNREQYSTAVVNVTPGFVRNRKKSFPCSPGNDERADEDLNTVFRKIMAGDGCSSDGDSVARFPDVMPNKAPTPLHQDFNQLIHDDSDREQASSPANPFSDLFKSPSVTEPKGRLEAVSEHVDDTSFSTQMNDSGTIYEECNSSQSASSTYVVSTLHCNSTPCSTKENVKDSKNVSQHNCNKNNSISSDLEAEQNITPSEDSTRDETTEINEMKITGNSDAICSPISSKLGQIESGNDNTREVTPLSKSCSTDIEIQSLKGTTEICTTPLTTHPSPPTSFVSSTSWSCQSPTTRRAVLYLNRKKQLKLREKQKQTLSEENGPKAPSVAVNEDEFPLDPALNNVSHQSDIENKKIPSITDKFQSVKSKEASFNSSWSDIAADIIWKTPSQVVSGDKPSPDAQPLTDNLQDNHVSSSQLNSLAPHNSMADVTIAERNPGIRCDRIPPSLRTSFSSMSSFTSEELRFINGEVPLNLALTDTAVKPTVTNQITHNNKLYVNKVTGNCIYKLQEPVEHTCTSEQAALPSEATRQPFKTPFKTPNALPKVKSLFQQIRDDNFVAFNKQMLAPLTSQREITLTADLLLADPHVLGQWGNKFILVVCKPKSGDEVLLAVDQHAAHERVRVEMLERQYTDSKTGYILSDSLPNPFHVDCETDIMEFLHDTRSRDMLAKLGIIATIVNETQGSRVKVSALPLAVRNATEQLSYLKEYMESVIHELIERDHFAVLRPKAFQDVVNSQACRGAIKFGDELTKDQCVSLIKKVGMCRLPFQCAHGRPSCVPLLDLASLTIIGYHCQVNRLNFSKLKLAGTKMENGA